MPKAATYSDVSASASLNSADGSPTGFRRSKRSLSRSDGPVSATGGRKRANAESLAARLGPELVRELEALLKPGMTEMPPFAVRQAIQKRYNINRRHIYDWFHSRGLRVTKEERRYSDEAQIGLIRPQRKLRQGPEPSMSTPELSFCDSSFEAASATSSPDLPLTPASSTGAFTTSMVQTLPPFFPGPFMQQLYTPPIPEADFYGLSSSTIQPVLPNSCLPSPVGQPSISCGPNADFQRSTFVQTPQAAIIAITNHASPPLTEAAKENLNPQTILSDNCFFSGPDQQSVYESLNGVLGPPSGFQESVGTYKAYMQRQNQLYYERLLSDVRAPSTNGHNSQTGRPSTGYSIDSASEATVTSQKQAVQSPQRQQNINTMVGSVNSPSVSEFSSWLLHTSRSHAASLASSRVHTPDMSSDAGTDHSRMATNDSFNISGDSGAALDIADILESPVLRSRNPSMNQPGPSVQAPTQEWRHNQANYPRLPADITDYRCFSLPLAPVHHPVVLGHPQPWEGPRMPQYAHLPASSASLRDQGDPALNMQITTSSTWVPDQMLQSAKGKARATGKMRTGSTGGKM
ncbi:hypothetical protein WOLCODRAFT_160606 [Wolfiporia cocos MD-104 SS10]|uniref:Uncharacterized protein n=1 Tax=Wolfiporia cocos (strain MD-104) TaxID=742152 RepID=A0A2H3IVU0_WOLCO|nr:hypothetical protein WOLCODRAFT_160606 [Wolfiporia cocos MD-104 SS10]